MRRFKRLLHCLRLMFHGHRAVDYRPGYPFNKVIVGCDCGRTFGVYSMQELQLFYRFLKFIRKHELGVDHP